VRRSRWNRTLFPKGLITLYYMLWIYTSHGTHIYVYLNQMCACRTDSVDAFAAATYSRGIKSPFWVLRVRPPSSAPFNTPSRCMYLYTVELAPTTNWNPSRVKTIYILRRPINIILLNFGTYCIFGSRSFRHVTIPQPFSGGFFPAVYDRCHNCFPYRRVINL